MNRSRVKQFAGIFLLFFWFNSNKVGELRLLFDSQTAERALKELTAWIQEA
jgi:transposase